MLCTRHGWFQVCVLSRQLWQVRTLGILEYASKKKERIQNQVLSTTNSNVATIVSALRKCTTRLDLLEGKRIHDHIIKNGLDGDVLLGNFLIHMYGKCGALLKARETFDNMSRQNTFSWNIIIGAYVDQGEVNQAIHLFDQMPQRDVVSWTTMIGAYGKNGQLKKALQLFQQMPERNVVSLNTIIKSYGQHGQVKEAMLLLEDMKLQGMEPDKITYLTVIDACGSKSDLSIGKLVHANIFRFEFQSDIVLQTSLLNMYANCGSLEDASMVFILLPFRDTVSSTSMLVAFTQQGQMDKAQLIFEQMPQKDIVSWTAMISGYVQRCQLKEALQLFEEMPQRNAVSWTAMIVAHMQEGKLEEACKLFDQMPEHDAVSWNVMISAYAQQGHLRKALQNYAKMLQEGFIPDKFTYIGILDACANTAALVDAKKLHNHIISHANEPDIAVQNAIVNMYAKCASLKDACMVFDRMLRRNLISWTIMTSAYAQHGHGKEVVKIVQEMQSDGMLLDETSFFSLLSACSHAGLVDDGCHWFLSISGTHGLIAQLEHCNCIIDLLGRTVWLDEAEDFIASMPLQPGVLSWTALLGSCQNHVDVERGIRAAFNASDLDPNKTCTYVLLANIYAAAGLLEDAMMISQEYKNNTFPICIY